MNNDIIVAFAKERFSIFDGYVSVPIFDAPTNYSSYHDSEIDRQIVVTLPDDGCD
ncbi:MAG: hypothetical protein PUC12_14720 [Clostridiales bacterium]|nr:hypothetical protein [Clostridiales bacterium]